MKIAVIDSGVHAAHPHVGGVAGGMSFCGGDFTDRLGHGTAVTAVIRALAPDAEVYAVKIFHDRLSCDIDTLIAAIHWCRAQRMDYINLSLGTSNAEHAGVLREAVAGLRVVAAKGWLPGDLPGVIAVGLDWECPWDEVRLRDGVYYACGYPRPIPGVPAERNLRGISFAVAHVTGKLATEDTEKHGEKL